MKSGWRLNGHKMSSEIRLNIALNILARVFISVYLGRGNACQIGGMFVFVCHHIFSYLRWKMHFYLEQRIAGTNCKRLLK